MGEGEGRGFTPPPPAPVVPDPVEHVVEDAPVAHADGRAALQMTAADRVSYTLILPPPRRAEKPPRIDPTEVVE